MLALRCKCTTGMSVTALACVAGGSLSKWAVTEPGPTMLTVRQRCHLLRLSRHHGMDQLIHRSYSGWKYDVWLVEETRGCRVDVGWSYQFIEGWALYGSFDHVTNLRISCGPCVTTARCDSMEASVVVTVQVLGLILQSSRLEGLPQCVSSDLCDAVQ